MKFVSAVHRRLPWLHVPAGVLLVLLQRTPAVRVFVHAKDYVLASRAGEVLRAAFTVAALGALHSRAGATTFEPSAPNPVRGTVGTQLDFAFTYTGTPSSPASFQFSGTLPPGLRFVPTPLGNTLRSGSPAIVGIPTQAGTFTIQVQGFNADGLTNNVQQPIVFEITGGTSSAPTITTPPQSQTVNVGANVTFSVQAGGTPPLTFQWSRDGTALSGATASSLSFTNVQASAAGDYSVVVTNSAGSATSAVATLTVNSPGGGGAGAPAITAQPIGFTAAPGSTAALAVSASGSGNQYQWRRNGAAISGATDATLLLPAVSAAAAGDYSVVVTNSSGSVASSAATVTVEAGEARLANLSVRANLAAGQTLIVGFATNGEKSILIRGIGPTLGAAPFNFSGVYADPRLEVYEGSTLVTQNEDWSASLASAFTAVGAFPLGNGSRDAALQSNLQAAHSAHLKGPGSGVTLVELYDSGGAMFPRLINVSARNFVGTGDDILIAGFNVSGTVAKTLLIRAVGPSLQALFGLTDALTDPKLEIYNSAGAKLVENDNWSAALAPIATSVGGFALVNGSRDAALLVSLSPGSYTAQVAGVANGTGEALVEVYEVP